MLVNFSAFLASFNANRKQGATGYTLKDMSIICDAIRLSSTCKLLGASVEVMGIFACLFRCRGLRFATFYILSFIDGNIV